MKVILQCILMVILQFHLCYLQQIEMIWRVESKYIESTGLIKNDIPRGGSLYKGADILIVVSCCESYQDGVVKSGTSPLRPNSALSCRIYR